MKTAVSEPTIWNAQNVKSIEYYQNGTVKRVEYFDLRPMVEPAPCPQLPVQQPVIWPDRYAVWC